MKTMHLSDTPLGPVLVEGSAPAPGPRPNELLIRVQAAGVIPAELTWYPTSHTRAGERRVGAVPAHEFAGAIEEIGKSDSGHDGGAFETGQEVFGMNDWFEEGALAEYCVAPFSSVAAKPRNLTPVEAASVPISALTAWQGLFDRAKLQPGERVLVHGAAGGVGVFATQLAASGGAYVAATASERNLDFVRSLGAAQVIDYEKARFEQVVANVDIVFDTVGGATLEKSWGVLKPGGRMVTVASTAGDVTDERVKAAFFIVEPNRKELSEIGRLIEAGHLRTFVEAVVPLRDAASCYSANRGRHGRGKVVVSVAP